MSKFLYLDTETTGLHPNPHSKKGVLVPGCDIIELAYICEIDGMVVGNRVHKIQPVDWESIEPKALEVNKTTVEDLRKYPSASDVFKEVLADFYKYKAMGTSGEKLIMVAHNVDFDKQFLMSFFEKQNKIKAIFSLFDLGMSQCTMRMAATKKLKMAREGKEIGFTKVGLEKVAKAIGVEIQKDRLHSALYDTELCKEIFHKLFYDEEFSSNFKEVQD